MEEERAPESAIDRVFERCAGLNRLGDGGIHIIDGHVQRRLGRGRRC
jgi:hypothetical protein